MPDDSNSPFPDDYSLTNRHHQHINGFHQPHNGLMFPHMALSSSLDHSIQMLQQVVSSSSAIDQAIRQMLVEQPTIEIAGENEEKKKKKKPHKDNKKTKRAPKKSAEVVINGVTMDISSMPIPICTCTGNSRQCYRWGSGGWQSSCCTNSFSSFPLPYSTKRRGVRIAGRKMSPGGFKKVLERLSLEGYDFSAAPIDLRNCWAKHGTNKFVTIR